MQIAGPLMSFEEDVPLYAAEFRFHILTHPANRASGSVQTPDSCQESQTTGKARFSRFVTSTKYFAGSTSNRELSS